MTNKPFSSLPKWLIAVIVIFTYFVLDHIYLGPTSWGIVRTLAEDGSAWQRISVSAVVHYIGPQVLVPFLVAALIVGHANVLKVLGFNETPWRGLGFAFLCTLPLPLVYAFTTPLQETNEMFVDLLNYAVLPGISEEVLFRCFLFGLLFRLANWGFLPAAMFGALIFGAGHLHQGGAFLDSLGVFGITLVAGLWWAWMYVEWDYNAWVPIGFHVCMNTWFNVFVVSDTALLPITGEIARALVVLISIALTISVKRRNGGRKIVGRLWLKGSRIV